MTERMNTVVGLDLSLTGAGVGVILNDDEMKWTDTPRLQCHTISSAPTGDSLLERHLRIEKVRDAVLEKIRPLSYISLVTIEDMPYGASGRGTVDRTWLWGGVVSDVIRLGIPILQVNVSTVKIYATGKGNKVGKDEVMLAVARRYPDAPIKNNNEADAFALAAIAARLVGEPVEGSLPQTHLRAMDKLTLP